MSDKDEIKELFQKELGNYEAKVDPSLWNGIQSGLTGASAAGGTVTGISIATKAVIGVVIATVATISVVVLTSEETKTQSQAKVETIEHKQEPKENLPEELVVEKSSVKNDNSTPKNQSEINHNPTIEKSEIIDHSLQEIKTDEIELQSEIIVDRKEEEIIDTTVVSNLEVDISEEEEMETVEPFAADLSIQKQDNQYVKFEIKGEGIERVEWSFGDGRYSNDFSPEHFYEEPGNFEVVAIIYGENNEIIEKSINVSVKVEGKFTNLPNTFTPNNDGSNDEFFVEFEGIKEFQLTIFNQRQELIFSTNELNFRWRGFDSKGERVPEGEYVYVIIAKDKAGNVINKYKTLTITR